ncbi:MAG: thiamine phosphate synthase [Rhodospirillales bacterium]|nr:thiamine phosphate synthase [Rhodospirillales bacterium]MDE2199287.1 thiamine phosphate synthase [Rhodospirillales bacterium]MDE2575352.1 thiamine phosphate synthase [Rhodospirillales bacterium]
MPDSGCRLYLVTPPAIHLPDFAGKLAVALDAGDVAALQIRLKGLDDDGLRRAIDALRPVAHARGVAVLMNDRPDLAVAHGCDGAHVGQSDTPARDARKILGDLTMGVTCHASRDLAMQAGEDGANYVAFGAFYPTETKEASAHAEPEILQWWSELMELPCVAIGGITAANCAPLVQAGADFLAVIGAVWNHPDGEAAGVRALNAAIAEALSARGR